MNNPLFSIAIVYIMAAVMIWGLVLPEYGTFSQTQAAADVAREELQKIQEIKGRLSGLNQEYQAKREEIEKVFSVLPAKEEIPSLLVQIEALSGQNGMILKGIDFQEDSSRTQGGQVSQSSLQNEMAGNGLPAENLQAAAAISVKKMPVSLSLEGSYVSLVNFLKAVENTLRLMDVESLDFQEAKSQSGSERGGFSYTVNLMVYYK